MISSLLLLPCWSQCSRWITKAVGIVSTFLHSLPEHGHPRVRFFHILFPPLYAFQILAGEDGDKLGLLVALEGLSRLYDVSWVSAVVGIKECCFYGWVSFQLTF